MPSSGESRRPDAATQRLVDDVAAQHPVRQPSAPQALAPQHSALQFPAPSAAATIALATHGARSRALISQSRDLAPSGHRHGLQESSSLAAKGLANPQPESGPRTILAARHTPAQHSRSQRSQGWLIGSGQGEGHQQLPACTLFDRYLVEQQAGAVIAGHDSPGQHVSIRTTPATHSPAHRASVQIQAADTRALGPRSLEAAKSLFQMAHARRQNMETPALLAGRTWITPRDTQLPTPADVEIGHNNLPAGAETTKADLLNITGGRRSPLFSRLPDRVTNAGRLGSLTSLLVAASLIESGAVPWADDSSATGSGSRPVCLYKGIMLMQQLGSPVRLGRDIPKEFEDVGGTAPPDTRSDDMATTGTTGAVDLRVSSRSSTVSTHTIRIQS